MRYDLPEWEAAVAALSDADEIAIACHVNPDGDAGVIARGIARTEETRQEDVPHLGNDPRRRSPRPHVSCPASIR